MTFKILLFLALTALATCETSFRPYDPMSLLHVGAPESIEEFFGGIFKHFNLTEPTQIPSCFGTLETIAFFAGLHEFNKIIEAINERDNFDLYIHLIQEFILNFFYRKTATCIAATQDFTDLLDALDIEERDYRLFVSAEYLYMQAHFQKLIKDFKPVISALDSKNYLKAGQSYGTLVENMVNTIKKEHFGYLYLASFSNGFTTGIDVSYPSDSLKAWNGTTAAIAVKYIYGMSEAVSEGEPEDAQKNAARYYNETGKELLAQIPESVFDQMIKSKDNQEWTRKLGVNIISKEFGIIMHHYVTNNPKKFYLDMKLVNSNMESLNFMNAGFLYGKFVKLVAES